MPQPAEENQKEPSKYVYFSSSESFYLTILWHRGHGLSIALESDYEKQDELVPDLIRKFLF